MEQIYILCVDDDEEDCHLLTEAMQQYRPGIHLKFLPRGDIAVRFLKENPGKIPSLIILDINIPGMNGKDTFLEMKRLLGANAYPAIFLTTAAHQRDVEFAHQQGVEVMQKPNSLAGYRHLAAIIMEILQKSNSA